MLRAPFRCALGEDLVVLDTLGDGPSFTKGFLRFFCVDAGRIEPLRPFILQEKKLSCGDTVSARRGRLLRQPGHRAKSEEFFPVRTSPAQHPP